MAKPSALGTRPANSEKKSVGIVELTKWGDTRVKFTLVDKSKPFANGKSSVIVAIDDLPAVPALSAADEGKQFRIRLNKDEDGIEAIGPVTGHYTAKLIELGKKLDDVPTPFEKTFTKDGKEESHLEFFVVYQITKGRYKGLQLPGYYLHYKFESDGSGNTRYAGSFENKKATRLFQLKNWMEVHRLEESPITWHNVTILPELQKRALASGVLVDVTIKNGYPTDVMVLQDEDDLEDVVPMSKRLSSDKELKLKEEMGFDDEVDTAFPKARSAKKVAQDEDDL